MKKNKKQRIHGPNKINKIPDEIHKDISDSDLSSFLNSSEKEDFHNNNEEDTNNKKDTNNEKDNNNEEEQPLKELYKTGFKILEVDIEPTIQQNLSNLALPIKLSFFIKQHEARNHNTTNNLNFPAERTLFITNLPIDTTENHIRNLFKEWGSIEQINFRGSFNKDQFVFYDDDDDDDNKNESISQENKAQGNTSKKRKRKNKGVTENSKILQQDDALQPVSSQGHELSRKFLIPGATAYVVFQNSDELKNILNTKQKKRVWNIKDQEISPLGLNKWFKEYQINRPDPHKLQVEVDEYMRKFEEIEEEKRKELEEKQNQPDEEGFITVTRAGRRNANTDGTITVTAAKPEEIKNLKPKNKELPDFYRFQMRESKRNKHVELRKKFEEDKRKIERLKAARRFKPY
ncbi:hypothetical protein Glove_197g6 [Diversispora epigaea]|uniref:RRM domain-containing protein n=1 Tax=Diversispora epigaea TaxID=1348612 RepID=A0A397IV25_9GLOM|nr:hypothetical protein Glove_197g6 [Diversispora epigaea]